MAQEGVKLSVENVRGCPSETVSEGTGSAMHCVLCCAVCVCMSVTDRASGAAVMEWTTYVSDCVCHNGDSCRAHLEPAWRKAWLKPSLATQS